MNPSNQSIGSDNQFARALPQQEQARIDAQEKKLQAIARTNANKSDDDGFVARKPPAPTPAPTPASTSADAVGIVNSTSDLRAAQDLDEVMEKSPAGDPTQA